MKSKTTCRLTIYSARLRCSLSDHFRDQLLLRNSIGITNMGGFDLRQAQMT